MMKSVLATIFLLFALSAAPALAQDRAVDWTLWASAVDVNGTNRFDEFFEMDAEGGVGFGMSLNVFQTERLSTEVAIFSLRTDADLLFEDFEFEMGRIEIVPVTLGLQYHVAGQSHFDPYVGAGIAWVMASDSKSSDLDILGIGAVEFDDEFTYFANAGLGFHFTDKFGAVLDVRYINYEPTSNSAVTGGKEELELSPLFASL